MANSISENVERLKDYRLNKNRTQLGSRVRSPEELFVQIGNCLSKLPDNGLMDIEIRSFDQPHKLILGFTLHDRANGLWFSYAMDFGQIEYEQAQNPSGLGWRWMKNPNVRENLLTRVLQDFLRQEKEKRHASRPQ